MTSTLRPRFWSLHVTSVWYMPPLDFSVRWVPKLLYGIYRTGVTWRNQNLGHLHGRALQCLLKPPPDVRQAYHHPHQKRRFIAISIGIKNHSKHMGL